MPHLPLTPGPQRSIVQFVGSRERAGAYEQVIDDLIHVHARVARDVVEIAPSTWAIHGPIAVDGEVIMAAFTSRDAADVAIDRLWAAEQGTSTP